MPKLLKAANVTNTAIRVRRKSACKKPSPKPTATTARTSAMGILLPARRYAVDRTMVVLTRVRVLSMA